MTGGAGSGGVGSGGAGVGGAGVGGAGAGGCGSGVGGVGAGGRAEALFGAGCVSGAAALPEAVVGLSAGFGVAVEACWLPVGVSKVIATASESAGGVSGASSGGHRK